MGFARGGARLPCVHVSLGKGVWCLLEGLECLVVLLLHDDGRLVGKLELLREPARLRSAQALASCELVPASVCEGNAGASAATARTADGERQWRGRVQEVRKEKARSMGGRTQRTTPAGRQQNMPAGTSQLCAGQAFPSRHRPVACCRLHTWRRVRVGSLGRRYARGQPASTLSFSTRTSSSVFSFCACASTLRTKKPSQARNTQLTDTPLVTVLLLRPAKKPVTPTG